jgi:hypothetical protein
MNKTLYTLSVDDYEPEITALTFPLLKNYARKIGAEFVVITERRWPCWPVTMEKFQVGQLSLDRDDDWSLFFDADALIHPDAPDVTAHLSKDTVLHHGLDRSTIRFAANPWFRRDGRFISPGNWMNVSSDWCRDVWEWPRILTIDSILDAIHPQVVEIAGGVSRAHLIDDYVIACNEARYGLKVVAWLDLCKRLEIPPVYFWHIYRTTSADKLKQVQNTLTAWGV